MRRLHTHTSGSIEITECSCSHPNEKYDPERALRENDTSWNHRIVGALALSLVAVFIIVWTASCAPPQALPDEPFCYLLESGRDRIATNTKPVFENGRWEVSDFWYSRLDTYLKRDWNYQTSGSFNSSFNLKSCEGGAQ